MKSGDILIAKLNMGKMIQVGMKFYKPPWWYWEDFVRANHN